jgi:hypothetical protein
MSKELRNVTEDVMGKIREGKLTMRPRAYFIVGSFFMVGGLTASIVASIFFVSLTKFALRTHGPMGQYRWEQLVSSFPWWAPLLAIVGLGVGLWLLRQYDFSYKNNPWIVVGGFVVAIIIAGWIMDTTGLNEIWLRRGPMQGLMKSYLQ